MSGFEIGPTINACTKGLWIWGRPLDLPDGKTKGILIDTEGLGSLQRDQTMDTTLFSLCTLLSSTIIWNSTGSLDESALEGLSCVVGLSKSMVVRPG